MEQIIYGNSSIIKKNGSVYLENVPVKDLVNKYRTPLFAFMKNRIITNIEQFKKSTSDVFKNSKFFYSVKANYLSNILHVIDDCGVPFEIVSEFEYDILKRYKLDTNSLLVGGPYLPESLIIKALENPDPIFVVYSIENCKKIEKVASQKDIDTVKTILRIVSPKKGSHLGFRIDKEKIRDFKEEIALFKKLDIIGLLSHYGTQMNTVDKYVKNASYVTNIATILEDYGILNPKIFNFGGGFPIACSYKNNLLTNTFRNIHQTILDKGFNDITCYFEPGRYIVGDAGVGLTNIININQYEDSFYVNAGGNIFPRFAKNPLRFYDIDKPIKNYNTPVNIYGIVLTEADILAKKYNFTNSFSINDTVMITNCGAYSLTFSNRFPYQFPETVLIDRNHHQKIQFIST